MHKYESLEDRRLLANVTVGNANDVLNGTTTSIPALIATPGADGISLREAILAANADATADVIDFAPSVTGTIQLTNVGHAGEIAITNSLTINGPGASVLTVRGFAGTAAVRDGARIFNVSDGAATIKDVLISGLTLSGGDVNNSGGAIFNLSENLTIADSTISGNTSLSGGGLFNNGGNLSISRSTVSGNSVFVSGAGIESIGGSLNVFQSTISNNSAGTVSAGGGIRSSSSTTTIDSSTISGNSANFGGGITHTSDGIPADMTIVNSTISSNSARTTGGGILASAGNVTVRHSTITLNRADSDNDGGGTAGGLSGSATLDHTIVAGNLEAVATVNDLGGAFTARFSLIGSNTGALVTDNGGNLIGTGTAPINPLLGPLANNGGPTLTHSLRAGSPAIEAGDPAAAGVGGVPLHDQRGTPYARIADRDGNGIVTIDLGAVERSSLVTSNFMVDALADEDDDIYTAGDLSLREAILLAEFNAGAETITFAPALTAGGPATILLTMGELRIGGSMTIQGPGAALLTIDAQLSSGVFDIDDGSAATMQTVSLQGLTITRGRVASSSEAGGGISNAESLQLERSAVVSNFANSSSSAAVIAGGILNRGSMTIVASSIRSSSVTGAATRVGGIANRNGSLVIRDSTVSANLGGILNLHGSLMVIGSTISSNEEIGLRNASLSSTAPFGIVTIRHSTIANNNAGTFAGGINSALGVGLNDPRGAILDHTIIAGNTRNTTSNQIVPDDFLGAAFAIYSQIGLGAEFLGPLANNGGPTMTHALLPGSPALDAGDANAVAGVGTVPSFDQRGLPFARVHGSRIDIGAFEVQPTPANADFDADFDIDGSDFLVWQRGVGLADASATLANGNADGDSDVDAADLAVWRTQFGVASIVTKLSSSSDVASSSRALSPAAIDRAGAIDALYALSEFARQMNPSHDDDGFRPAGGLRRRGHVANAQPGESLTAPGTFSCLTPSIMPSAFTSTAGADVGRCVRHTPKSAISTMPLPSACRPVPEVAPRLENHEA